MNEERSGRSQADHAGGRADQRTRPCIVKCARVRAPLRYDVWLQIDEKWLLFAGVRESPLVQKELTLCTYKSSARGAPVARANWARPARSSHFERQNGKCSTITYCHILNEPGEILNLFRTLYCIMATFPPLQSNNLPPASTIFYR